MTEQPQQSAVLTGDLVASTRAGGAAVDRAMAVLADAAGAMASWTGGPARFTRASGDGWQVLCPDPTRALRATLFLSARLRAEGPGLASRIAIGIGAVTSPGSRDLADADGPAFHRSGRQLPAIRRGRRLALAPPAPAVERALFVTADAILRAWTVPQAEAIAASLPPNAPRQEDLARRLGLSQQATSKRLSGGGFWALEAAMAAMEGEEENV